MVFSNVGGAGLLAIASISRRCSAIPNSKAGVNSFGSTLSHGGTPSYGPLHSGSRMLFGTATDAAAGADAPCAFATVPSAAMERMAVVASKHLHHYPSKLICPAERIADEPLRGNRDFDERPIPASQ